MVLVLLWSGIGRADGVAILVPSPEQEKRDKQRFEWEKQDRQDKQRKEEAAEKAAKEEATASAYAGSRRERIAKSKRRAKAEGRKTYYNSWQLKNR
jgi:flagellar biosynthesis/type III secretory pathway protein FliH